MELFLYIVCCTVALIVLQSPDMLQRLADNVNRTMKHALEAEEKVPLEEVTDFNEASNTERIDNREGEGEGEKL